MSGASARDTVAFSPDVEPGTIVISASQRKLFYVVSPGVAIRYPVAVPKRGKEWSGYAEIDGKYLHPDWTPPEGGESLLALRERVSRTVHDIAHRHLGELIVMVAHGGVLDALYRVATGQEVNSPRTWELPNGAINRLLWTPGGLSVVGWSDTQHLEGEALGESSC